MQPECEQWKPLTAVRLWGAGRPIDTIAAQIAAGLAVIYRSLTLVLGNLGAQTR